jgi:predicted membrane-bound spermidine synthase
MFITGFSASGLEILLLFGLQVYFGNIYLLTSFVITSFMLGLAVGSFFGKSLKSTSAKEYLSVNQLLIGVFAAATGILLFSPEMVNLSPAIAYLLYLAATVVIGCLTGFQFTQASLNRTGSYAEISGKTYSYDLFGSAFGALAVTLYLAPKLGIVASAFTISFLNLVFGIFLTLMRNRGIKLQ